MRCVLFGHQWVKRKGDGQYEDQEFVCCADCGKTQGYDHPAIDPSVIVRNMGDGTASQVDS